MKFDVALVLDRRFAQHSCVTLVSLLRNNPGHQFVLHCLHRDVAESDWKKIEKAIAFSRCELRKIRVQQDYPTPHFYKLAVADQVEAERVLYLDSDVVVSSSLQHLWTCDLEGFALAAVEDVGPIDPPLMSLGAAYFNSGVMLMDLKVWKTQELSRRVWEWTLACGLPLNQIYYEQHGLNACVDGRWKKLPLAFNQQSMFFDDYIADPYLRQNPEQKSQLEFARKHPSIIHFTGVTKPWQLGGRHPYGWQYWRYRWQTPYRFYLPENLSLINLLGSLLPDKLLDPLRLLRYWLGRFGFNVERLYGPGGKDTEHRRYGTKRGTSWA